MRYLKIDNSTHVVLNAELWETEPNDGLFTYVQNDEANIGDIYDPTAKTFSTPPAPPASVPEMISMMQARLALLQADKLDDVETAVAAADKSVQIYWEYTTELHRDHPIVAQLATAVGLTSDQVDDLYRAAAKIT